MGSNLVMSPLLSFTSLKKLSKAINTTVMLSADLLTAEVLRTASTAIPLNEWSYEGESAVTCIDN